MKIVACYSNKGGVGKTATAVNLAYASAINGNRTLLCDLDPQGASGFYLRVKPSMKLKDQSFFNRETDKCPFNLQIHLSKDCYTKIGIIRKIKLKTVYKFKPIPRNTENF